MRAERRIAVGTAGTSDVRGGAGTGVPVACYHPLSPQDPAMTLRGRIARLKTFCDTELDILLQSHPDPRALARLEAALRRWPAMLERKEELDCVVAILDEIANLTGPTGAPSASLTLHLDARPISESQRNKEFEEAKQDSAVMGNPMPNTTSRAADAIEKHLRGLGKPPGPPDP